MIRKSVMLLTVSVLGVWLLSGCASTASQPKEDLTAKLSESKAEAEAATRELNELRNEKARLEAGKSGNSAPEQK